VNRSRVGWAITALAVVLFGVLLCRTAWLCDDAFITFRTVDNLVHGHGLRWNVIERVQSYTHPLWLFLHAAAYFCTREIFLTAIFVSIGVSMAAAGVMAFGLARSAAAGVFAVTALSGSRAFVDYSTSGLENPLTHLLLAVFLALLFQERAGPRMLFCLSLTAALGVLNRMDTLLLYAPALAYVWLQKPTLKGLGMLALGFAPFAAWEAFSVVYYGFPFPNTAYAKLGTGIEPGALMAQGLWYFGYSLNRDAVTILLLSAGLAVAVTRREGKMIAAAAGILLYLVYVVRIGGDFMGGRFFAAPLLVAVALLCRLPEPRRLAAWAPAFAVVVLVSLFQPNAPVRTGSDYGKDKTAFKDAHGIGDERMFYFPVSSLAQWSPGKQMPTHPYADTGRQYRTLDQAITKVHGSVGFRGFFAGPKAYIIDYYALADPLLARLPAKYAPDWRIGHFLREIPAGYEQCAGSDANTLTDQNLAQYYDHLKQITRGPLWSAERWREIWRMNRGEYDDLIDRDQYRFPKMQKTSLAALKQKAAAKGVPVRLEGLHVDLDGTQHAGQFALFLDGDNRYRLLLMRGKTTVHALDAGPGAKDASGMAQYVVRVPAAVAESGYTALRVFPYRGNKRYAVGAVELTPP
jgi:arabinofuranosyltransferase